MYMCPTSIPKEKHISRERKKINYPQLQFIIWKFQANPTKGIKGAVSLIIQLDTENKFMIEK